VSGGATCDQGIVRGQQRCACSLYSLPLVQSTLDRVVMVSTRELSRPGRSARAQGARVCWAPAHRQEAAYCAATGIASSYAALRRDAVERAAHYGSGLDSYA
jgi:hypothetical protein